MSCAPAWVKISLTRVICFESSVWTEMPDLSSIVAPANYAGTGLLARSRTLQSLPRSKPSASSVQGRQGQDFPIAAPNVLDGNQKHIESNSPPNGRWAGLKKEALAQFCSARQKFGFAGRERSRV
jgi:hypothetical protein